MSFLLNLRRIWYPDMIVFYRNVRCVYVVRRFPRWRWQTHSWPLNCKDKQKMEFQGSAVIFLSVSSNHSSRAFSNNHRRTFQTNLVSQSSFCSCCGCSPAELQSSRTASLQNDKPAVDNTEHLFVTQESAVNVLNGVLHVGDFFPNNR